MENRAVVVKGAAAFVAPRASDRRDAARRMHVDRAVARARKSITEPKIGAFVVADEPGKRLDRFDRRAGNARRPYGVAGAQMLGKLARRIGVAVEIVPVGFVVAEQAMHHRAGERAVGARPDQHRQVGLPHRSVHINVDGDDLAAALFAGAGRMRHHVDLGVHRVGAPDHDQIGLRHFARIGAGEQAGARDETGPGRIDADGGEEAGIFLGMPQAVNAVAHDVAHRAGIQIRPNRLGAVRLFGADEFLGNEIERVVPRDRGELTAAFRAGPAVRILQAVRMMHALGVTRDLRADHAGGVGVILGAADPADRVVAKNLDFECAGRRTVVWTGRSGDAGADGLIHINCTLPRSGRVEQRPIRPALDGAA